MIAVTVTAAGPPMVVSVVAPQGFYKEGDTVPITVTFSEAVTVNTTGGTPQLALTTGNTGDSIANYIGGSGGSGTTALTFTYSVRDGDNIGGPQINPDDPLIEVPVSLADLGYAGTTALTLNSGTIQSADTGINADPTLPAPGAVNSLSYTSNAVLDTTAPTAISAVASADGTTIEVLTSETLTLTNLDILDGDEFILTGTDAVVQLVSATRC